MSIDALKGEVALTEARVGAAAATAKVTAAEAALKARGAADAADLAVNASMRKAADAETAKTAAAANPGDAGATAKAEAAKEEADAAAKKASEAQTLAKVTAHHAANAADEATKLAAYASGLGAAQPAPQRNWVDLIFAAREIPWPKAILIVFSTALLYILYKDLPVLHSLENPAYARGVITFIIAISAIGLAFMFSYQAFADTKTSDEGFKRGREVLTGLMGVLGTIVGFYFGSSDRPVAGELSIDYLLNIPTSTLSAHAIGGLPPYAFTLTVEPKEANKGLSNVATKDGWLVVPVGGTPKPTKATIAVTDGKGQRRSLDVDLKPVEAVAKDSVPSTDAVSRKDAAPSKDTIPTQR